ncbi:hypothetical protein DWV44_09695 [Lachnospira eligens]|nr:hypothetical protein DWV44_09695 [Lachnospira eligens]
MLVKTLLCLLICLLTCSLLECLLCCSGWLLCCLLVKFLLWLCRSGWLLCLLTCTDFSIL